MVRLEAVDGGFHGVVVRFIEGEFIDGQSFFPQFRCGVRQFSGVPAVEDQVGADLAEAPCKGKTDALRRSGNQCSPAAQVELLYSSRHGNLFLFVLDIRSVSCICYR